MERLLTADYQDRITGGYYERIVSEKFYKIKRILE